MQQDRVPVNLSRSTRPSLSDSPSILGRKDPGEPRAKD